MSAARKFDWRGAVGWGARAIVWLWPRDTKEWGQAFAAELPEVAGFSASIQWLIGGTMLLTREHVRSFWGSIGRPIGLGADVVRSDDWHFSGATKTISSRLPVIVSSTAHALILSLVVLASWGYVTQMPLHVALAPPSPPPFPEPPPEVTDARVFPNAPTLYSSLPLGMPTEGDALPIYVADGVGINFLSLPDIGATYRQGKTEWRVWPGQALESFLVRRVLPEYPREASNPGAVSVFVEYVILQDGSVKVLRTSGPAPYTRAAQTAIEQWVYRPLEYENRPSEVVSRVEVRFDGRVCSVPLVLGLGTAHILWPFGGGNRYDARRNRQRLYSRLSRTCAQNCGILSVNLARRLPFEGPRFVSDQMASGIPISDVFLGRCLRM